MNAHFLCHHRRYTYALAALLFAIAAALKAWAGDRSSQWRALRDEQVRLYHFCAVCGDANRLQAHHIAPFRTHPELELEATNVIVLCDGYMALRRTGCHYKVGHLGDFRRDNPQIEQQYGRGSNAVGRVVQEARRGK